MDWDDDDYDDDCDIKVSSVPVVIGEQTTVKGEEWWGWWGGSKSGNNTGVWWGSFIEVFLHWDVKTRTNLSLCGLWSEAADWLLFSTIGWFVSGSRGHSCRFEGFKGEILVWFNDPLVLFYHFKLKVIIHESSLTLLFIKFFLEFALSNEILEKIPWNPLETGKSLLYLSSVSFAVLLDK